MHIGLSFGRDQAHPGRRGSPCAPGPRTESRKVLIYGASVEGLTLAWCLVRQGYDVLVVEPRNNLGDEDYMMALFDAGYDASERLGLARLESIHDPVDRWSFSTLTGVREFDRLSDPAQPPVQKSPLQYHASRVRERSL